jgi:hypothetical protein
LIVTEKEAITVNQDQDTNPNERKSEKESEELEPNLLHQESDVPLFLRDGSDGKKGDAQDEKDNAEE